MLEISKYELILPFYSILVGLIIGVERELKNKPAGLRTLMLVSFGSCLFTLISMKISGGSFDRVASNIVTGIGFLGAGAIFRDDNKVNGVTTAAVIWVTAALGMLVGTGEVGLALVGSVIIVGLLGLMSLVERIIASQKKSREYTVSFEADGVKNIDEVEEVIRNFGLKPKNIGLVQKKGMQTVKWTISGPEPKHKLMIEELLHHKGVLGIEY